MSKIRLAIGATAMSCALALSASPALAHQFRASFLGKTKGKNLTVQELRFGPFHILCHKATSTGEITELTSPTLFDIVKYSECRTEGHIGTEPIFFKTHFKAPIDYEFHANGFVETGSESESEVKLVHPGEVELTVEFLKCIIKWPPQTIPLKALKTPEEEFSAITYKNEEIANPTHPKKFPSGFQKKISMKMELKQMQFSIEEGQCEHFKTTGGANGKYFGTLQDELKEGDLSIE
jgi:hypothetical protein